MALGAGTAVVVRGVVGRLAILVVAGLAIGGLVSWWAVRFVGTLLFGVTGRDSGTLIGSVVVLLLIAAIAAWIPARRAALIDPVEVLRE